MKVTQNDRNVNSTLTKKESTIAEKPHTDEVVNTLSTTEPDIEMAKHFLSMLSNGQNDTKFWFNTWDDRKDKEAQNQELNGYFSFKISDGFNYLAKLNKAGAAVGVQITRSATKEGQGKKFSYHSPRAVWVDIDIPMAQHPFSDEPRPHIVVQSSPNKYHGYWLIEKCSEEDFLLLLKGMNDHWEGGDKNAAKIEQPMRLPGFYHQKNQPSKSVIIETNKGPRLQLRDLVNGFNLDLNKFKQKQDNDKKILNCVNRLEVGDSELFLETHKNNFLFDCDDATWFCWNGNHWMKDKKRQVVWAVTSIADIYEKELKKTSENLVIAKAIGDEIEIKNTKRIFHQIKSSISRIRGTASRSRIVELSAQAQNGFGLDKIKWDELVDYLPVNNGLVNLVTGELVPGDQAALTKSWTPVDYDPDAQCPQWENFISEILTHGADKNYQPDTELSEFIHRLWGYAITGRACEDVIPMFYGEEGRNGKTTMFETIKNVLGDDLMGRFATSTVKESSFNNQGGARSDLIKIRSRLVSWVAELKENDKLDVSQLKELSGGDSIVCRGVYSPEQISFRPKHTIMMFTNKIPKISSEAIDPIWMRVVVVPFYLKFVNDCDISEPYHRIKIPKIEDIFEEEKQGILTWLVKGAQKYITYGLNVPESVKLATENQKNEQDTIRLFTDECIEKAESSEVTMRAIYNRYVAWCKGTGRSAYNIANLAKRLPINIKKGYQKRMNGATYKGFCIKPWQNSDNEPDFNQGEADTF